MRKVIVSNNIKSFLASQWVKTKKIKYYYQGKEIKSELEIKNLKEGSELIIK